MARPARPRSAAPEIAAQDCEIESIRHSSSVAEPSGVPSSNQARRYHSPSQASLSSAVLQRGGVGSPCRGMHRVAACIGKRCERDECRVEQPAEPDALASTEFADAVHAVVPVAGADQRQPVKPDIEAGIEAAGAVLEQRAGLIGRGRGEEAVVFAGLQKLAFQERNHLVQHRGIGGRARHSARRRRPATPDRRKCACGRPDPNAATTNAGRRPRRTVARPRAAGVRASCRAAWQPAPCRPATGRGSRRHRSPDRIPNEPRCGRPASDTAASRSA